MADFTKIPLKKMEKFVLASTCVLLSQKWNGHSGIFTPKPINIDIFIKIGRKFNLKKLKKYNNPVFLKKNINPISIINEPSCVQNRK